MTPETTLSESDAVAVILFLAAFMLIALGNFVFGGGDEER